MNKHAFAARRRKAAIAKIVAAEPVHSQEQLLVALAGSGIVTTQPTLSRDIRELGLVKTPAGYVVPGALAPEPEAESEDLLDQAYLEFGSSVAAAGNLVILKTPAAAAQPLAHAIDEAGLDGCLGCIAGDDTIFVAMRTPRAAAVLSRRLRALTSMPAPASSRARA